VTDVMSNITESSNPAMKNRKLASTNAVVSEGFFKGDYCFYNE